MLSAAVAYNLTKWLNYKGKKSTICNDGNLGRQSTHLLYKHGCLENGQYKSCWRHPRNAFPYLLQIPSITHNDRVFAKAWNCCWSSPETDVE